MDRPDLDADPTDPAAAAAADRGADPAGAPGTDAVGDPGAEAVGGPGADVGADRTAGLGAAQRRHWERTYAANPGMYGAAASAPARYAAEAFRRAGARDVLELGAGHGRDALSFARAGFSVLATDFSDVGLAQLRAEAEREGLGDRVRTATHDVRTPLPLPDASVDAVYAHMLLCMALSTDEIRALVREVARVLRPGGTFVYTVRHDGDAHFGAGTSRGDDIWEHGGFAVHFFSRALVDELARGWSPAEVHPFEEGELPRRLWRVTQTRR